jgi:light-harvesting protein B-800-850 alpha chain
MKEGRIWLYVSPTVGLPLFFIAFVTASLLVHASIMTHTTWMSSFWQGGHRAAAVAAAKAKKAAAAPAAEASATGEAAQ